MFEHFKHIAMSPPPEQRLPVSKQETVMSRHLFILLAATLAATPALALDGPKSTDRDFKPCPGRIIEWRADLAGRHGYIGVPSAIIGFSCETETQPAAQPSPPERTEQQEQRPQER
jgi:hypothetical protein